MWLVIVHDNMGVGYPMAFAHIEALAHDMADDYRRQWTRVEVIFAETACLTSHIVPLSKWRIS